MSQLSALKKSKNLQDLAQLLGIKSSALSYTVYKYPINKRYRQFFIPKKSGGQRSISAPNDRLKLVQKRLSQLLQNCADEIFEKRGAHLKQDRSHGFKRRRSIGTNAKEHRNKNFVLNIDLEDFFDSFNFGRVRGFFISNNNFALEPKVATIIAQIACHENKLPQGSPSSPVITNLITQTLDVRLSRLTSKYKCTYSRYADDITISTNLKAFPEKIAKESKNSPSGAITGKKLDKIIFNCGFKIKTSKTRLQRNFSRQLVTGLVVNKKLSVPKEYRKHTRAMVENLYRTGEFHYPNCEKTNQPKGTIQALEGRLAYIEWVESLNHKKDKKNLQSTTYKKFLLYTRFLANKKPILLCEGKTDYVYITHALRQLHEKFPLLINKDKSGNLVRNIDFFRYKKKSCRILEINGGYNDLIKFISEYRNKSEKFKAKKMINPIIILADNDSAATKIRNALKNMRIRIENEINYHHLFKNLYLSFTPLQENKRSSQIEDFFKDETRKIKINGRTLSLNDDHDKETQYGKNEFAYGIVSKKAEEIDFSNFHPILENITSIIQDYQKKLI